MFERPAAMPLRTARCLAALSAAAILWVAGCSAAGSTTGASPTIRASVSATATPSPRAARTLGSFTLTSSAYADGDKIPVKYTCVGDNVSPPLTWHGAPAETAAYVLIMIDDGAQIVHWVAINLPGGPGGSLAEGISREKTAPAQIVRYLAPCPGQAYRGSYVITLYALSAPLDPAGLATESDVEDALAGKVLAVATLTGWDALDG